MGDGGVIMWAAFSFRSKINIALLDLTQKDVSSFAALDHFLHPLMSLNLQVNNDNLFQQNISLVHIAGITQNCFRFIYISFSD